MRPYTIYDDFPGDIANALKRADAWWYMNDVDRTLTIKSRNKEAPLTEKETVKLQTFLALRGFNYKVVFIS